MTLLTVSTFLFLKVMTQQLLDHNQASSSLRLKRSTNKKNNKPIFILLSYFKCIYALQISVSNIVEVRLCIVL